MRWMRWTFSIPTIEPWLVRVGSLATRDICTGWSAWTNPSIWLLSLGAKHGSKTHPSNLTEYYKMAVNSAARCFARVKAT
jgi:hypothetical protein